MHQERLHQKQTLLILLAESVNLSLSLSFSPPLSACVFASPPFFYLPSTVLTLKAWFCIPFPSFLQPPFVSSDPSIFLPSFFIFLCTPSLFPPPFPTLLRHTQTKPPSPPPLSPDTAESITTNKAKEHFTEAIDEEEWTSLSHSRIAHCKIPPPFPSPVLSVLSPYTCTCARNFLYILAPTPHTPATVFILFFLLNAK